MPLLMQIPGSKQARHTIAFESVVSPAKRRKFEPWNALGLTLFFLSVVVAGVLVSIYFLNPIMYALYLLVFGGRRGPAYHNDAKSKSKSKVPFLVAIDDIPPSPPPPPRPPPPPIALGNFRVMASKKGESAVMKNTPIVSAFTVHI